MSESLDRSHLEAGYQEVQVGPDRLSIPEDWEVTTIEAVSDRFISGGTPDSDEDAYWGGEIPWTTCAVVEGPIFDGEKDFITEAGLKRSSASLVPEGGILFGTRVNVANVGRTTRDIAISQDLTGIVVDESQIDPDYLTWYLLFNQSNIRERYSQGSTIQGMITSDLKSLQILRPPLPEQRRIADILSAVNEQIQRTDEIIEEAEDLREGLAQDLVFGRGLADEYQSVRLGSSTMEIPNGWSVKTFSDVAAVEKGNTPKTSNDKYYGGDITWVTPDDLSDLYDRGEKYISDSNRTLTEAGLDSTSVNIVDAPSVMFTSRSYGIGKTAICTVPAATNQGIIAFHCNEEMSEEYLYYYLNQIMDYIIALSGVSTFPEVSLTDIRNLRVPVPTRNDREYIEQVLQKADERLVAEKEAKEAYQDLKRGLMQDLLTGKVRVSEST